MYACERRHEAVANNLITLGADVNAKDRNGRTALMNARGHSEMITILENTRTSTDETAGSACSP